MPTAPQPSLPPALASRFTTVRRIGEGGSATVYEARDHVRRLSVALKVPRRWDARSLVKLKREFHAVCELHHPNLVAIHDLLWDEQAWLLSMELVDGVDFVSWVRHRRDQERRTPRRGHHTAPMDEPALAGSFDEDRLRAGLQQLALGLSALHDAGYLHCDVKPSNVLVTATGRVVLLDFDVLCPRDRSVGAIGGTPGYQAPELVMGGAPTEASDWYAVGVLLYEALAGRRPFPRDLPLEPVPPSTYDSRAPADLVALSQGLLELSPHDRPSRAEIFTALGLPGQPVVEAQGFVGRARELAVLEEGLAEVVAGRPVAILVHGEPGIGKTALVGELARRAKRSHGALVLTGRCYLRADAPFPALDGLVDSLAAYLETQPRLLVDTLAPRDAHELVRLFPALGQLEGLAHAPRRRPPAAEVRESRRRGLRALHELLARLAEKRPLVLVLDDLQWGDEASSDWLAALSGGAEAVPALLVGCYRSGDVARSTLLERLVAWQHSGGAREIALGPLDPAESHALVAEALAGAGLPGANTAALVDDAQGSPYLLHELVALTAAAGPAASTLPPIDRLLDARLTGLTSLARRLLELVAIAGEPVASGAVIEALGRVAGSAETVASAWHALVAGRWIRIAGREASEQVECYHDRLREALLARQDDQKRRRGHLALARALQARGDADPEVLLSHLRAAGELEAAGGCAERAAERAAERLAFEAAAVFRRLALFLRPQLSAPRARRLWRLLGHDLDNGGRPVEAAEAFMHAADGAPGLEGLEFRRRAAELLLHSGHYDRGLPLLAELLEETGLRAPRTPLALAGSAAFLRLQARLERQRRAEPATTSARVHLRIDVCRTAAVGLAFVDGIASVYFQQKYVVLSQRSGDDRQRAFGLLLEGFIDSAAGTKRLLARASRHLAAAAPLVHKLDDPRLEALALSTRAALALHEGHAARALTQAANAEQIVRDRCRGAAWELGQIRLVAALSRVELGKWVELATLVKSWVEEARERGDLELARHLKRVTWRMHLLQGRPERATAALATDGPMPPRPSELADMDGLLTQLLAADIMLYQGDPHGALGVTERCGKAGRLLLPRAQILRIGHADLFGRAAVAASLAERDPEPLLVRALEAADRLAREPAAKGPALALTIRALVAARRGDAARSVALLDASTRQFAAAQLELEAAVTARALARLRHGSEDAAAHAHAERWMRAERVADPERVEAWLLPGLNQLLALLPRPAFWRAAG
jgi:hypothetical protein